MRLPLTRLESGFSRPSGLGAQPRSNPALKRRAIIGCPSGTDSLPGDTLIRNAVLSYRPRVFQQNAEGAAFAQKTNFSAACLRTSHW